MNIFHLGNTPIESARAHCDQHLHKMILESAQIASTACFLRDWRPGNIYKPAYLGHPCVKWVAESNHNLLYVLELARELEVIRQELGHPYHASSEVIKEIYDYLCEMVPFATSRQAQTPALAMPLHIRARSGLTPVQKYQAYYRAKNYGWIASGKPGMTWKHRDIPSFMVVSTSPSSSTSS